MDSNIIAAIVGALVTAIIGFIAYQYQIHRGNRVIVLRLSQTPQISFSDSVQKKLKIIYKDVEVKNLVLTQFVIYNQGNTNVKPLKLIVNLKPKGDNFTYAEVNVSDPQHLTQAKVDMEKRCFRIERPYLNPQRKYKEEEIKVSVFSDIVLDFSVSGGGEDWASKLEFWEDINSRYIRNVLIGATIAFFIAGWIVLAGMTTSENDPIEAFMLLLSAGGSFVVAFVCFIILLVGTIRSQFKWPKLF